MGSTPDKDAVIEKVRKLINLAASTNQREAERAAFKACALIRDHGLDVCDPDVIDGVYKTQQQLEDQVRRLEAATESYDGGWAPSMKPLKNYGHVATSTSVPLSGGVSAPKYTAAPPPMTVPVALKGGSKFDAICLQCGGHIKAGDPALWQKGKGMWHQTTDCYQKWVAAQQATSAFDPYAAP